MIAPYYGRANFQQLMPLNVQQLSPRIEQIGLFFTLAMVASLMFQILGGWLSDSIGRVQAVAIGNLAGLAGYISGLDQVPSAGERRGHRSGRRFNS
jgi:MFS family permease